MSETRYIRLKERSPELNREITPPQQFIERADETLESGPFLMRTDNNGFIVTGNDMDHENSIPIVLTGDSFVESSFCHEGQRFIDRAERLMPGYKLLNGGYSGATTLQLFNVMLCKVYPLFGEGGNLVFFVGQSDADILNRQGSYWTNERLWSPIVPNCRPASSNVPKSVEAVEKMVEIVIQTSRILGINLLMAISPFRDADFKEDLVYRNLFRRDFELFQKRMRDRYSIRETIVRKCDEYKCNYVDFQELTNGEPSWFYDDLHLNRKGHENFSRLLAGELRKFF
ncbi:MAG: SGNH/GDSL hydrolase family protein [Actinomycetaceae bacterium]|nr:SGNH/GDSL hydrolase family protein [Actinomycetaceae bacterium]